VFALKAYPLVHNTNEKKLTASCKILIYRSVAVSWNQAFPTSMKKGRKQRNSHTSLKNVRIARMASEII
jgi:hypothetical protein